MLKDVGGLPHALAAWQNDMRKQKGGKPQSSKLLFLPQVLGGLQEIR